MLTRTAPRKLAVVVSVMFVRGGIPRFNQMLCLALDELAPELDLDVSVISQDDTVEDYRRHDRPWKHLTFIAGNGKAGVVRRALAYSMRERPELLLVGLLGMTPVGAICRPFVRRGFGFVVHGIECWPGHPQCERRWSRLAALRRASFALAVSRNTAEQLGRLSGIARERILILPNALEPQFERIADSSPPAADGGSAEELLTVSRLWAEEGMKGVDHTLSAVARLAGRYPRLRYRIVGNGSDKPRLVERARALGIHERVLFEEGVSDGALAEIYRRCSIFVLPSGQEGFGIVFLEAMRFAKPCIGGDAGGTPEVIDHGRTGLLVRHGDVDGLVAALDRLLADANLRASMGWAGRDRLLAEFGFDSFRRRLAGHLDQVLGRHESGGGTGGLLALTQNS